jgi:hypothetical protein
MGVRHAANRTCDVEHARTRPLKVIQAVVNRMLKSGPEAEGATGRTPVASI